MNERVKTRLCGAIALDERISGLLVYYTTCNCTEKISK